MKHFTGTMFTCYGSICRDGVGDPKDKRKPNRCLLTGLHGFNKGQVQSYQRCQRAHKYHTYTLDLLRKPVWERWVQMCYRVRRYLLFAGT